MSKLVRIELRSNKVTKSIWKASQFTIILESSTRVNYLFLQRELDYTKGTETNKKA